MKKLKKKALLDTTNHGILEIPELKTREDMEVDAILARTPEQEFELFEKASLHTLLQLVVSKK